MGDPEIECAAQHGAHVLEGVDAAEVMPESQGDGRQLQAAPAAAAIDHAFVTMFVGRVHGLLLERLHYHSISAPVFGFGVES